MGLLKNTNLLLDPTKKILSLSNMKKKELRYFAYRILSENTLHFILLCSSYIIPTHRKTTTKKRLPLKKLLFSLIKKFPLPYPLFLTTNIHFCHYLYKNL